MPALRLGQDLPSGGLCWYVIWYTYIIYRATYVYSCSEFYSVRKSRGCRFKSDRSFVAALKFLKFFYNLEVARL